MRAHPAAAGTGRDPPLSPHTALPLRAGQHPILPSTPDLTRRTQRQLEVVVLLVRLLAQHGDAVAQRNRLLGAVLAKVALGMRCLSVRTAPRHPTDGCSDAAGALAAVVMRPRPAARASTCLRGAWHRPSARRAHPKPKGRLPSAPQQLQGRGRESSLDPKPLTWAGRTAQGAPGRSGTGRCCTRAGCCLMHKANPRTLQPRRGQAAQPKARLVAAALAGAVAGLGAVRAGAPPAAVHGAVVHGDGRCEVAAARAVGSVGAHEPGACARAGPRHPSPPAFKCSWAPQQLLGPARAAVGLPRCRRAPGTP